MPKRVESSVETIHFRCNKTIEAPIYIGSGAANVLTSHLDFEKPIVILTDRQVADHHLASLKQSLIESGATDEKVIDIILKPGESYKNLATYEWICNELLQQQFKRDVQIVALGGGVITDIAGFVASTYCRGVPLFSVPTSLLAQIDAAIGGKTGINFQFAKNWLGHFYAANAIFVDPDFLQTLPEEEFNASLGELCKYAILKGEPFFEKCQKLIAMPASKRRTAFDLPQLIQQAIQIKLACIGDDFEDQSKRQVLNLGHTFGHAIESICHFKIRHGEAVAFGLYIAAKVAQARDVLDRKTTDNIVKLISPLFDIYTLPKTISAEDLLRQMTLDKKNNSDTLELVLPHAFGDVRPNHTISKADLEPLLIPVLKKLHS